MKANETRSAGSTIRRSVMLASALAVLAGCGTSSTYDPYADYYAYGYYYPADLAYADQYYADDYYGYSTFYPISTRPKAMQSKQATSPILSLSRAESLCPGHVTFTPKTVDAPCNSNGEPGSIPAGATIVFSGCQLAGGGLLDGTMDIDSTHTFSDNNCDAQTTVSVSYRSVSNGLSFTAPSGARVVTPVLSRTGSYTRLLMTPPSAISISTSGSIERYAKDGSLVAQAAVTGTQGVILDTDEGEAGYRVDGTLTMQDTINARKLTVTGSDVVRTETCCRPLSGTITITSSGSGREDDVWRFGPECGDLELNGESVQLSECF